MENSLVLSIHKLSLHASRSSRHPFIDWKLPAANRAFETAARVNDAQMHSSSRLAYLYE